jgi:hypothetical protein
MGFNIPSLSALNTIRSGVSDGGANAPDDASSSFASLFDQVQNQIAGAQAQLRPPGQTPAAQGIEQLIHEKIREQKANPATGLRHMLKSMLNILLDPESNKDLNLSGAQSNQIQAISARYESAQYASETGLVKYESILISIVSIGRTLSEEQFKLLLDMVSAQEPESTEQDTLPGQPKLDTALSVESSVGNSSSATTVSGPTAPSIGA